MDKITILTPTYNRTKFLPLYLMNLKNIDYPHHLLELIIDDDGSEPFISNLEQIIEHLLPIKLTYIRGKIRKTIGKKRDSLIKACNTKIFCFMDDDDIYMPSYIPHSLALMKEHKAGCVGSDKMLFTMSAKNFDVHMIDCGNTKRLIHEATLMMTKKYYRASCGFANSSKGEGAEIFTGNEKNCVISDITKIIVCLQHAGNTVEKLQFANKDNKIDLQLSDELISLLKDILKDEL